MRYAVLVHTSADPWGHPTSDHTREYQALTEEQRTEMNDCFDQVWAEIEERGEMVSGVPLGDPADGRVLRWNPEAYDIDTVPGSVTQAPERLAGWFVFDVDSPERIETIARAFCVPGDTVEIRPLA